MSWIGGHVNDADTGKITMPNLATYLAVTIAAHTFRGNGRSDSVSVAAVHRAGLLHADMLMLDLPNLRDVLHISGIKTEVLARHVFVLRLIICLCGAVVRLLGRATLTDLAIR